LLIVLPMISSGTRSISWSGSRPFEIHIGLPAIAHDWHGLIIQLIHHMKFGRASAILLILESKLILYLLQILLLLSLIQLVSNVFDQSCILLVHIVGIS